MTYEGNTALSLAALSDISEEHMNGRENGARDTGADDIPETIPLAIFPAQFRSFWNGCHPCEPGRRLAVAVFREAIVDIQQHCHSRSRSGRTRYRDAVRWVLSNDRQWPYSFVNLCEAFNLPAGSVRQRVLAFGERAPA